MRRMTSTSTIGTLTTAMWGMVLLMWPLVLIISALTLVSLDLILRIVLKIVVVQVLVSNPDHLAAPISLD